jgi:hypothetical protein
MALSIFGEIFLASPILRCQVLELRADGSPRFEAFDEPWKAQFNTPGAEWEDKWGLMDPARNLKSGLTIPDCSGEQAT